MLIENRKALKAIDKKRRIEHDKLIVRYDEDEIDNLPSVLQLVVSFDFRNLYAYIDMEGIDSIQ